MGLSRTSRRWLAGAVLSALPVVAVLAFKQTSWAPMLTVPHARQWGPRNAKVMVVEYSDFQCPMCAKIQPTVREILTRFDGKVHLIYKYFPLRMHPNAMPAARAAECAAKQDKFWPYHELLFQRQTIWGPLPDPTPLFRSLAQEVGLDRHAFDACLTDHTVNAAIENDVAEAHRLHVEATPTFFVGKTRLVGAFFEAYGAKTIEDELK